MKTSSTSAGSVAGALLCCIAACDRPPDYRSAGDQLGIVFEELSGQRVHAPEREVHVVEQSRLCPTFTGWFDDEPRFHVRSGEDDDAWLRECFSIGASGNATVDADSCVVADAPGAAALELTATPCDVSDFVDDSLPIVTHAASDLVAIYDEPALRTIVEDLHPGPAATPAFPADPPAGEPVRVVAGDARPFVLQPLVAAEPTRSVAFTDARVVAADGTTPVTDVGDGVASLSIAAGQMVSLDLVLPSGTLAGGPLLGVDASEIATIELLVGYAPCEACDDGYAEPLAAVVVARDAQGRRLRLPDVTWTASGDALPLGQTEPGATTLEPDCEDAVGEARSSELTASVAGKSATVTVAYVCPEPGAADHWEIETVDDDAPDEIGCACSADPSGGAMLPWLVVVPLVARRRRLRASR